MAKKDSLKFLTGAAAGFSFFWLFSNPRSKVRHRLPEKKIKSFGVLPNIKVQHKETEYHLHHWINLAVIYGLLHLKKHGMLKSKLVTGFLVGGILQGLSYKDRFQIRKKLELLSSTDKQTAN